MDNGNRRTKMFYADIEHKQLGRGAQRPGMQLPPATDRILEGLSSKGRPINKHPSIPEEANDKSYISQSIQKAELPIGAYTHQLPEEQKDQYKWSVTLLDLGGEVRVVQKRGFPKHYAARQLNKDNAQRIISQLTKLRHENLVAAVETFTEGNNFYIIVEKVLLSLIQIVRSPPIPSPEEIGIIIGQILDGLVYLQDNELAHGTLSCVGVLIDEIGNVKLTTHQLFVQASREAITKDIESIAEISMMLMQKYKLDNGKVGVERVDLWKNSEILEFLSYTTSCKGPGDLRQNPFISCLWKKGSGWPKEILCGLVEVARLTVPRSFRYNEKSAVSSRYSDPTYNALASGGGR